MKYIYVVCLCCYVCDTYNEDLLIFFFNDTATTEIYTYCHTLSLHDALPILRELRAISVMGYIYAGCQLTLASYLVVYLTERLGLSIATDRKSTRLNSSH